MSFASLLSNKQVLMRIRVVEQEPLLRTPLSLQLVEAKQSIRMCHFIP
jgi:hypothetical protein